MFDQGKLYEVLHRSLKQGSSPTNLISELGFATRPVLGAEIDGRQIFHEIVQTLQDIANRKDVNAPLKVMFKNWLNQQDSDAITSWGEGTRPNSLERRLRVYSLLGVDTPTQEFLDRNHPPFLDGNILIAGTHESWYSPERRLQGQFYGPSILAYLESRDFSQFNLNLINQATDEILDRLADPNWSVDPGRVGKYFAARGLVVGYVQSGKTTNINVLIAKSIDAGYRLVIVLAGLTDLLRQQTQRRIDKEVVGKAILINDPNENEADGYVHATDWMEFIEHRPLGNGAIGPEIERLTTRSFDFHKGLGGARFQADWVENGNSVRIVVIKKNTNRLKKLIKEIEALPEHVRSQINTLIIDDESDQASINTLRPMLDPNAEKKRTAVNAQIVKLLKTLKRAQYVGYTATPFANVFVDPQDGEDLFPKDFIYSLQHPEGYMGVKDFHDLDEDFFPRLDLVGQDSNKWKHVREINCAPFFDDEELRNSIDAFLLAGALKLYRTNQTKKQFKHHTYFFTDSTNIANHEGAKQRLETLWESAGYNSALGLSRLKKLYETDFVLRSEHKKDRNYFPDSFEALKPFVFKAIEKIDQPFDGNGCVLMVNSDKSASSIDFEVQDIWKMIVGGAKLSRGFTIEGLTTTYFRRRTQIQATLLQMGRWFGYRAGYRDLVRLFISRNELVQKRPFDVYSAFESICRDEEAFRIELRRYSEIQPDGTRLTPAQIPPLVQNSHPQLRPVARNQMFNAVLTSRNFGGTVHTNQYLTDDGEGAAHNVELFDSLFGEFGCTSGTLSGNRKMLFCTAPHERIKSVICSIEKGKLTDKEKLFRSFLDDPRIGISDWAIIVPQAGKESTKKWSMRCGEESRVLKRTYDGEQFATYGDQIDRPAGWKISGNVPRIGVDDSVLASDIERLSQVGRAVLMVYPVRKILIDNAEVDQLNIGIECFLPTNKIPIAQFIVRDPNRPHAVVV